MDNPTSGDPSFLGSARQQNDDQIFPGPPSVPQLPPQMFTTAAQILDLTDKKILVSLRDGRNIFGVLRSWDQYGNIVIQDSFERIYVQKYYADVPYGIFMIRGENVTLLGEIDLDREDIIPAGFEEATIQKVHGLQKEEMASKKRHLKIKNKKLMAKGFEHEQSADVIL